MMPGQSAYDFRTGTALVTGAAGGIGEQLALGLAQRGSDLVLMDRNAEGLAAVAARIGESHPGVAVQTQVVDLADRPALLAAAEQVAGEHPGLSLLVNNAGVALGGDFEHLSLEEFDWVMDINFRAPVALTHALLPRLLANPGSHIVNMSSLFGLIAPPGQSPYSSSKFALRGFSEALRTELAGRDVGVTVVHPGGVRTQIAASARIAERAPDRITAQVAGVDRLLRYPPEKAAAEILSGVRRRRARVLIAPEAVLGDLAVRVSPVHHATLLEASTRVLGRIGRIL